MSASTTPAKSRPLFDWLFAIAVLALGAVLIRIIRFTPYEATQGAAQKIYYIHVPAALSAYLALFVVAVTSVIYLWLKDERSDWLAESAAEVAFLFTTAVLITGPLWGKPVWGTWWTWDARLSLTLFLWFLTVAYLVMRGAIEDRAMRARFSAVLGVLAALLVPFIHLSVYLFRTLHPDPIVLKPEQPSLPGDMLLTWTVSVFAHLLFCGTLIRARYRLSARDHMVDPG